MPTRLSSSLSRPSRRPNGSQWYRATIASSAAAKRRKATPIDADQWLAQLLRQRSEREQQQPAENIKPEGPFSTGEIEFWLRQFEAGDDNA